jgi:hypothetical protein
MTFPFRGKCRCTAPRYNLRDVGRGLAGERLCGDGRRADAAVTGF